MEMAYLALGSNLNDPLNQINKALAALSALPLSRVRCVSSFYRTPPYGRDNQPDYLNAVVGIETALTPNALLKHTAAIEQAQGRARHGDRWQARTLDIDILLYGNQTINTPTLTIPHYDMHHRAFVLVPLAEIAPDLRLPDGRHLQDIIATVDISALQLSPDIAN